uniref:PH domain-containing protein n=1 Tax=Branchiostoma floridae TaxID=7739 RepID=C3XWJ7_BRAFL|eukprot:XP_002611721.1 hypothetical protein BRAFLDRAFT_63588 [Branchiostoma floridae]
MSEGQIICRGWLRKSPPEHKIGRASWKKRWFVLREGRLTGDPNLLEYYKRDNAKKPIAAINLDQCEQVDAGLTFEKKEFVNAYIFDIVTPKRTYFLVTDSEAEMNHWVGCICQVCGFNCTNDENGVFFNEWTIVLKFCVPQGAENTGNLSSSQSSVEAPPPRPPKPVTSSPSVSRGSPASVHSGSSSSARGSPRQASRASPQTGSPRSKLSHQNGSAGSPRPKPTPRTLKQPPVMPPVDNGEQYFPLTECTTGDPENRDVRSPAKQSPRSARTESRKRDSFPDMPPPLPPTEYNVLPHSKPAKAMTNGNADNLDVYSVVPPPRPVTQISLCSNPEENYDLVPPPRPARQASSVSTDGGEAYDMVPARRLTNQMSVGSQQGDVYDVVPPTKISTQLSNQSSWSSQQDMYDTVPHRKLATQLSTHSSTGEEYNTLPSANMAPSNMGIDFAQDYQVPTATQMMRMNSVKQQPIPIRNRSGDPIPPPGLDDFYDFPRKLKSAPEAEEPPPPVPRTAKQHHYINAATSEITQDENYIAMAVSKASETSPDNVYTSMASGPKGMAEGYTDDFYMFMGVVDGIPSPPPLVEVTPGPAPAPSATPEKKPADLPPPIRRDLKPGSRRSDGRPGKANIPPPLDLSGTSNFTEEDTYGVFPIKSPITKSFSVHGSNGYKPPQPKDSADTEDTDSSDSEDYEIHKTGSGSALLPQIYHPMEGIGKAAQEAAKAKKKDKVEYLDLEMSSSPDMMEKAKKPSPRSSPLPQRTSSTVYTRLDIDRTVALSKTKEARQESYRTSEGS